MPNCREHFHVNKKELEKLLKRGEVEWVRRPDVLRKTARFLSRKPIVRTSGEMGAVHGKPLQGGLTNPR